MEDVLQEGDDGRAVRVGVGEGDLEAEDGVGVWACVVESERLKLGIML